MNGKNLFELQGFYFIEFLSQVPVCLRVLKPVPEWIQMVELSGSSDGCPDFTLGGPGSGEAVCHDTGQTALSRDVSGEDRTLREAGQWWRAQIRVEAVMSPLTDRFSS